MSARHVVRILLWNTAVALLPVLIMLTAVQGVTLRDVGLNFVYSLIYAQCIGWLGFTLMPRLWTAICEWPAWKAWPARIAGVFAITVAGSLAACLILVAIAVVPADRYWAQFVGSLRVALFVTVLVTFGFGMYETFRTRLNQRERELQATELERERALKLATEAQLASLESRIHPHFLFNTLNSISALIPEDPERAERLVEQMSALLRFSLDSHQRGLVPLSSELKIVSDYLEIEKARFGERLRYSIEIPSEAEDARVPPLSLQTLVENSVKYAVAPSRSGGEIRVNGRRENGILHIQISDDGPPFRLDGAPPGHGLDSLKSRLAALYGDHAALSLSREGDRNHLALSLPQIHASISS